MAILSLLVVASILYPTIEAFVDAPKCIVYILSYNEDTRGKGRDYFKDDIYRHITIQQQKYLENIMYLRTLDINEFEWANADYVGTLSYKAPSKMQVPDIARRMRELDPKIDDVVVFSAYNENLLDQAVWYHGQHFEIVWLYLLKKMGYTEAEALDPMILAYCCNYWMATPAWMRRYIAFFKKAHAIMEGDQKLSEMLHKDSMYHGGVPPEMCMELFGRPYYTYHPFVCERLSCFFFHRHGARIAEMVG